MSRKPEFWLISVIETSTGRRKFRKLFPAKKFLETFSSGNFFAVNFFRRKLFPGKNFSAETFSSRNFSNRKVFDGKFSLENQSSYPRTDFSAKQQFEFFKKRLPLTNWAWAVNTVVQDLLKNLINSYIFWHRERPL